MKMISNKRIVTVIVTIFLCIQNIYASPYNGLSLDIMPVDRKDKNNIEILTYDVHLQVLEQPMRIPYLPNRSNFRIIDKIKARWYDAQNHNYLWLNQGDDIVYPFKITHVYTVENHESYDIAASAVFFPLMTKTSYPLPTEHKKYIIYTWEDYGIRNPQVIVDNTVINFKRNYALDSWPFNYKDLYTKTIYTIHKQWNWDLMIPAWDIKKIEFSYYAVWVKWSERFTQHPDHYGYYRMWIQAYALEDIWIPIQHSVYLPVWYQALFPRNDDFSITQPGYTSDLPVTRGHYEYIEIIKDSD